MVSIIIPTIRPQNIPRLLEAIKNAISCPHEVIWEEDKERIGAPKMVKKLTDKTQYDWVVFLGDDTLPHENCIDNALEFAQTRELLLVGFNDQHGQTSTHWLANKKLLTHLENGEFFNTQYIHNYCDDELRFIAEKLDVYGWCPTAIVTHNHPAFTGKYDDSYKKQTDTANWKHDRDLFAQRNCKISVALIVKNEEAMLEDCLNSVKDADEIVVCDTGSTDKTVEIAKKFTDKVYTDYTWKDDFSEARNHALSKCTGGWVLSIDADEILEPGGIEKLRNLVVTSKKAIGIRMSSGAMPYHVPRLFRNIPSVKWIGLIHEIINVTDYEKCDVTITYRSSPAHAFDPHRNLRMLQKAHAKDPKDTRIMFYLAREYAYYRDWENAEQMFERYLEKATWLPEKADAYFMLALCYWYDGMGNGEKTRENCLKAININAHFKAPILLMIEASFPKNAEQWRRMAETADNSGTLFARNRIDIF